MTTCTACCAIYNGCLDHSTACDSLGVSGPEGSIPEGGVPGNIWYPFQSQCDWDFAWWAKNRGLSSTSLGLSYHHIKELNHIINEEMPGQPKFKCEKICIGSYPHICALFVDPRYFRQLIFALEHHYQDAGCTTQVFGEMFTRKWWWSVQQSLELHKPGATVLPLIISSDKTLLTHFQSKSAYPIYLLISNIPKDIHSKPTQQAQMLMGYIPATELKQISNKAAQCWALTNLFHSCICKMLSPIKPYGVTSIAMATGDGILSQPCDIMIWYCCHPILVTFIGDYPEQSLVACTYCGRCPKCTVPQGELGTDTRFPLHNFRVAVNMFSLSDGNPTTFHAACQDTGLKPMYHPFWECIIWLSKLTSGEHKSIACIILGIMVDLSLPGVQSSVHLTHAMWALLIFIYLSQYPMHTTQTLNTMDSALCRFHENKDMFIERGVWEHFNLPKLHSLLHYTRSITLFSNKYKQMTTWLECQESMHQHTAFIEWCKCRHSALLTPLMYPHLNLMLHPFLMIHPSEKGIMFGALFDRYGAIDFQDALANFIIVQHNYPELSTRVSIFHRVKFINWDDTDQKTYGNTIPGQFDTALVKHRNRIHVAQICIMFQLPRSGLSSIFLSSHPAPPTDIAYVEWFSPLSMPNESHGMYQISRSYQNNCHLASIIPLAEVCRSVQLFPAFGPVAPWQWQGPTVLEECHTFYINSFLNRHLYQNLNVINENC
ncbi:hypothetical protein H4582DRAFT_2111402 [Lactarius indigo]|nr:hypothetical protein H4582DRAFT_2111402 [Lactarius indigo]